MAASEGAIATCGEDNDGEKKEEFRNTDTIIRYRGVN